jgi:hypothetical protein
MTWLTVVVALVLGAAITWLLTVKRVTRTIDEAAGFAGTATGASASDLGWDRAAQDEDALLAHDDPAPTTGPAAAAETGQPGSAPIAAATPNGDLAGVSAPRESGARDEPATIADGPALDAPGRVEDASVPRSGVADPPGSTPGNGDPRGLPPSR